MKVSAIALAVVAGTAVSPAFAQFTDANSAGTPKVPTSFVLTPGGGGFLGGSDACASPQDIGSGQVFGQTFDTTAATTGPEHQSESLCYAFGTSAVDTDVWFKWTSAAGGNASVTTCNGTSGDTKMGAYDDTGGCPTGSAIACNDDSCGLQSTVTFAATPGNAYVIQLGAFPGASGATGAFDVTESAPPPCGQYDNGSTENALGLTAGGEMAWLHFWDCAGAVTTVHSAYGSAMFPGSVTNGNNSQVALYTGGDANSGPGAAVLVASTTTTVTNGDTDILNPIPLAGDITGGGWALVSADMIPGEFPGPMDQDASGPEAWVVGNTTGPGTIDITNLNNNNVAPLQMQAIGFAAYWLLRIDASGGGSGIGTNQCFGDGSGTACPCGNPGANGGCANATGDGSTLGAESTAGGTLNAGNAIPGQPGLFFQGDNSIGGGSGISFGDGLRCCGANVVRLGVVVPDGNGDASLGDAQNLGGASAGDTKCYQYWYRNPNGSPCGAGFNLSNAVSITW